MIKTLYIKNFILIDELLLEFQDGFNVLLGETGAGKSIIIKAIDVVLGAKTSKDALKDAEKHALIEICFENNGTETIISREISQTGTKCRLNGALVTLDTIKDEREKLIDIHSQFQTYAYMQQKFHIDLLDLYIASKEKDYKPLLLAQKEDFSKFTNSKALLEKLKNETGANNDRIEFLKFQIDEIEKAEIEENEEEKLNSEFEVLSNVQELKELSYGSYWTLYGDENSIIEALSKIRYNMSKMKDYDNSLISVEESFCDALETLKDVSSELRNYSEALSCDPNRLDEVNERLELIQKLKRKYGDIFESYQKFSIELENLEKACISTGELENEIENLSISLENSSKQISNLRKKYAVELGEIIENELKKLEFDNPSFKISVENAEMNSKGIDYVEFLITTNAAKNLAPLAKTASGGEISRVMLAIKTIFADKDNISTIIFDEIDTGISGKTSISVAAEIVNLSKSVQVLAITHQPIIASKSNCAFWISKIQAENNTKVYAAKLDDEGKLKALAQLSSGVADEKSINFAKELIN